MLFLRILFINDDLSGYLSIRVDPLALGESVSIKGLLAGAHAFNTKTVFALPFHDDQYNTIIAAVSNGGEVKLFPNTPETQQIVAAHNSPIYYQA
jgi:hypothetical protein